MFSILATTVYVPTAVLETIISDTAIYLVFFCKRKCRLNFVLALAVVNIVLVIGSCYVVVISEKPENIGVFATGIDDKVDLWWYTTRRTKTALIIDGVKH